LGRVVDHRAALAGVVADGDIRATELADWLHWRTAQENARRQAQVHAAWVAAAFEELDFKGALASREGGAATGSRLGMNTTVVHYQVAVNEEQGAVVGV